MVQNNKVLTVSYGTFSCTLEGFDDSFETMKAIAEYFRDLAADDRYFGSEPPQPDAEMLTRIAQRDASRRVEASQSESGLLLRATEDTPQPAVTAQTPQPPAAPTAPQAQAVPPAAPTPPAASPDLTVVNSASAPPPAEAIPVAEHVDDLPPPAADSIAAKLQRIRAVVSHSDDSAEGYSEDLDTGFHAPQEAPKDAISAAFEAGALSAVDFEAEQTPPPAEEAAPVEDEAEVTPEEVEESAEVQAAQPQPEDAQEEYEEEPETQDTVLFSDLDETSEDDAEETDAEEDDIRNIMDEDEDEASDAQDEAQDDQHSAAGFLTAEDEIRLLDQLSEVEAHLSAQSAQRSEPEVEEDVSRLLVKADERMEDPDTSGNRETYSHLRAAVAATEAEKTDDADAHQTDEEYRDDLASVVSPRRPEIEVTSLRPESDSTMPLKLVAEQRIDTEEADTGPVVPRRVTTEDDAGESRDGGFAHFAKEQGAQSLPDLLEAAAAYLSFIEGQEQFSRPQLMNKIRALKQDDFNREESLRSFGQLLRDGKIEKAGGGRFAASTQIGFRPDDKRAAG